MEKSKHKTKNKSVSSIKTSKKGRKKPRRKRYTFIITTFMYPTFSYNKPFVITVANPIPTQKSNSVLSEEEGKWGGVMACGFLGIGIKGTKAKI